MTHSSAKLKVSWARDFPLFIIRVRERVGSSRFKYSGIHAELVVVSSSSSKAKRLILSVPHGLDSSLALLGASFSTPCSSI